jgi:hypothetical protein
VAIVTPLPLMTPPATWRDVAQAGGRIMCTASDDDTDTTTLSAPLLAGETQVFVSRADWKHHTHP